MKKYICTNIYLNSIFIAAILTIVSFNETKDMPVIVPFDVDTVNYYYEIFVNFSIGYIISLLFYNLVVYYPEQKRKLTIKSKTATIIARLQTYLYQYIFETFLAFDIPFKESDDFETAFIQKAVQKDIYEVLSKKSRDDTNEGKTSIQVISDCSQMIIKLKSELVPFLLFMDHKEVELYTDLEDIFIFENIYKLGRGEGISSLFFSDFEFVIDAYKTVEKLVGAAQFKIEYDTDILS